MELGSINSRSRMKWHYTANDDFPDEHYDSSEQFLGVGSKFPDCLLLDYFIGDGDWQDEMSGHIYDHYEIKKWIPLREVLNNIED